MKGAINEAAGWPEPACDTSSGEGATSTVVLDQIPEKAMETKTVMMPRELTSENGAKAAMIGEFCIRFPVRCCCEGDEDNCTVCGGRGEYMQPVYVPWTMIKEIYSAAVKLLGC